MRRFISIWVNFDGAYQAVQRHIDKDLLSHCGAVRRAGFFTELSTKKNG